MRLEGLRVKGMGPFRGDVELDLAALDARLVAIVGPNGAGKSSLLELFAGALFRGTPTRGSLASLANRRDACVEARVINGRAYTIRQHVDAISGKGEAVVLDDAGAAMIDSAKVRAFDEWARANLPAPEVFYASVFSAQGSGGFLDLKPAERKAVLLRVLGIERLELLADRAREHARATERALAVIAARVEEVSGSARRLDELKAQLGAACAGEAEWAGAVNKQEADLAAAREAAAAAEAAAEQANQLRRRQADLERRSVEVASRHSDLVRRLQNNRAVLAQADEIARAVARIAEIDAELGVVGEERATAHARVDAAELAALTATNALSSAERRERVALDETNRITRELDAAERQSRGAENVEVLQRTVNAAWEAVVAARQAIDDLNTLAADTAGTRIDRLRTGLTEVIDARSFAVARRIARDALAHDDHSETGAGNIAARTGETQAAHDGALARHGRLVQALREAEAAQSAAGRRDDLRAALEAAKAPVAEAVGAIIEAKAAVESHREARANAIRTSFELGHRIDELRAERARLEPIAKRAGPLAQAEARITELEPQLEQLTAELAAIASEGAELPDPPEPPWVPNVELFERQLELAREQVTAMRVLVGTLERELAGASDAAARVTELEGERARQNEGLADWTKLALDLGKDGLQALIVDAAGPELTELANDLLRSSFGPRWTVSFETTRRSADGRKQLEVFDINVVDTERGRDGGVEGLSGGERVIVGEAISLALTVLACRRAGVERPTLVRDESGAALDEENGRAWIAMLRRAADLIGADKVLYVTHARELQELADARVLVEDGQIRVLP